MRSRVMCARGCGQTSGRAHPRPLRAMRELHLASPGLALINLIRAPSCERIRRGIRAHNTRMRLRRMIPRAHVGGVCFLGCVRGLTHDRGPRAGEVLLQQDQAHSSLTSQPMGAPERHAGHSPAFGSPMAHEALRSLPGHLREPFHIRTTQCMDTEQGERRP